jgi:endo-1,4-beta-xylanase
MIHNCFHIGQKLITGFSTISLIILIGSLTSCNTSQQTDADNADTLTSLAEVYSNFFSVGVALSEKMLGDSMDVATIKKQFNSVTAENVMKWESIHPEPGKYDFDAADKIVDFGEENNMYIVGHVLVWHSQTPDWVFEDEKGNPVIRDTLLARMRNHIYTVVGRYKGRVHCWDVVNEAIGDNSAMRDSKWYRIIGDDYVEKAFEYANEADPEAILIYNDYSVPTPSKRDAIVKLIGDLQTKNIKIDGVGLQAHYHLDYPDLTELDLAIEAFAGLGMRVMITEMDINVLPKPEEWAGADVGKNFDYNTMLNPYPESLPDSMQTVLANRYTSFFRIFLDHEESIDRVTLWGIQDGSSWLNFWPVPGRTNYPLLFDRDYQPKKAYWSIVELVSQN